MSTNAPTPSAGPSPNRNRLLFWLFGLIVVTIIVVGAVWHFSESDKRQAALDTCRAGSFADAEPLLKDVHARRPDDVEILDCLARGYLKSGRSDEAEPYLTRLIALRPNEPEFLLLRRDLYQSQKRREEAYADATRLLELTPGDQDLVSQLMRQAMELGDFPTAEKHCSTLLASKPSDADLRAIMAQIKRGRGDNDGAARILDELIKENSSNYRALQARGILFDELGQSEQAIPLLRRVFDNDKTRRRTCGYQLALALRKTGQTAEADKIMVEVRRLQDVELFSEAIKSQPDNLELKVRLAESLLQDGHFADGVSLLEFLLKESPLYSPAHAALATHYEKQGQAELAAKHRRLAMQGNKRP